MAFRKGAVLLAVAPRRLMNRIIIRAHIAPPHESLCIKFPMFIPVCPHPLSRVGITPFVLETHRDAVVGVAPQFFHQAIVQFFGPFAAEKGFDRLWTLQERPVCLKNTESRMSRKPKSSRTPIRALPSDPAHGRASPARHAHRRAPPQSGTPAFRLLTVRSCGCRPLAPTGIRSG